MQEHIYFIENEGNAKEGRCQLCANKENISNKREKERKNNV